MKNILFSLLLSIIVFTSCEYKKAIDTATEDTSTEINEIENGIILLQRLDGTQDKYTFSERMKHYNVPGMSIAVLKDGNIRWAKGYGIANTQNGSKVNENTLFQAASISKSITALGVLKLAEEGIIDLDQDINAYLKNWKLPDSEFTKVEKVTLRRLLWHVAGINVPGYPGYSQTDTLPSLESILNGRGNTPAIVVDTIPGSKFRYSGGGYLVIQKVMEDVTGLPFEEYMNKNILQPMGMSNSTFEMPLPSNLHSSASAAYDVRGKQIVGLWHNYPEKAGGGLWTTPTDLAKYCLEIQEIVAGKSNGILTKESINMMLTQPPEITITTGLGTELWKDDSLWFGHGGKNVGYTSIMKAYVYRGDGFIIMSSADRGWQLEKEIRRTISDYYSWETKFPAIEEVELDTELLSQYAGDYLLESDETETLKLTVDGNGLMTEMSWEDSLYYEIIRPSHDSLFHDEKGGEVKLYKTDGIQFLQWIAYGLRYKKVK